MRHCTLALLPLALGCALAPAQAQHLQGLRFTPEAPGPADTVVARVSGQYPSAAFQMAGEPKVVVQGQAIAIELLALPPRGMAATVMTAFEVAVPLGTLPAGRYAATVTLGFKDLPMPPQRLEGSFTVLAPR